MAHSTAQQLDRSAFRGRRFGGERGSRIRPERIRITQVGLWFVVVTLLVGLTSTNTGNNSLYLVFAILLATLAVSGVISRLNLRRIELEVEMPTEVFAGQPAQFGFELVNTGRLLPRWLILLSMEREGEPRLVPYLPAGARHKGVVRRVFPQRGIQTVKAFHLTSVFPIGLFRKGSRIRVAQPLMVYPRLLPQAPKPIRSTGRDGDRSQNRRGWGHDVHGFRPFVSGDDPRSIHWKRSAQTGDLVFTERVEEDGHKATIVLDNAVGRSAKELERFELAVSEAATAAVRWLQNGLEVRLVTRDAVVPWATGRRHRRRLLEALALVEVVPRKKRWPVPLTGQELLAGGSDAGEGLRRSLG